MPSNVFRFDESWEIPNASVEEVYNVLSRGELLPSWWKGVILSRKADKERWAEGGRSCAGAGEGFSPLRAELHCRSR